MASRIFLVYTAENPVSLICLLLELATGEDRVVFLEQSSADKEGPAARLHNALSVYGFAQQAMERIPVRDWEDVPRLGSALARVVSQMGSASELYMLIPDESDLVLPTILARFCDVANAYLVRNDRRKVSYNVWSKAKDFAPSHYEYRRANVDLVTLLRAAGYKLFSEGQPPAVKVWPNHCSSSNGHSQRRYGDDESYTVACHEGVAILSGQELSRVHEIPEAALQTWYKTWCQFLISRTKSDQVYLCLYHATKKALGLAEQEWCTPEQGVARLKAASARLEELGQSCEVRVAYGEVLKLLLRANGAVPLGQEFEEAVMRRLVDWLSGQGSRHGHLVQSVWRNVRVCPLNQPERVVAEWDILIVLRNGRFLNIECKCGSVEGLKDWQARREMLRRINGVGARLIACLPLYTAWAHRSWFANQLRNLRYVREIVQAEVLPFTLRGQPREFRICFDEGARLYDTSQEAPFEEHLERIFGELSPNMEDRHAA